MFEDGATTSGSVTTVRRIGDTVRRPRGRWTPAVHALLRHLADVGFTRAPRVLGVDDSGREVLSLLAGEVAMRPWPAVLRRDAGVVALARWLREYHAAAAEFRPPADAAWFAPDAHWEPGMVVRHGDLGPWNSIWHAETLVGFIDWDFAEPGHAVDDVAQLAWYTVPLPDATLQRAAGFSGEAPVRHRFDLLCETYGAEPAHVLAALDKLQNRERARVEHRGGQGTEPWRTFLDRGDATDIADDQAWVRATLTPPAPPSNDT